ncbi:MAG: hypothetical protein AUG49_13455 [Catenulispora sp. 13_1_20CM_3_70_7]|jgi:hypothetical protein|nr:MAG: hypothetical protein AUG49_13455 [Catenulispora sp. 13_1_20CM_3_70_7]
MTTATHTQGLQAMYSPVQQSPSWAQWDLARSQTGQTPQMGQIPQIPPYAWQIPYQQQFGQVQNPYYQQQSGPYSSPIFSAGLEQHLAIELFKLGQLVLASAQQTGPQPGKPNREQVAYEIFRLGQLLQQAAVSSPITPYAGQFGQGGPYGQQPGQQFGQQFGQFGQFGQHQTPIWS